MYRAAPPAPRVNRAPALAPPGHRVDRATRLKVCAQQKVSEMPKSLQKIVGAFQMVPDPMARYKQLLYYATKLDTLPAEDHITANKVEGCVSQVWVKPELRADGLLYWRADSDSQLTKGLAALLVLGLSGCTPQEILSVEPTFIELLGLKQSLTPSRNNGFLNMFKLMQRKTLEVLTAQATQVAKVNNKGNCESHAPSNGNGSSSSSGASTSAAASSSSKAPVQEGMRRKLTEALKPQKLVIVDQSASHAGHAGMMTASGRASKSGETHFKVEVVSEQFEGMPLVKRQRLVYSLLQDEFGMGLHALSLDTKTPAEVNN
eukprot:CAMPEP_0202895682 /NCGR_PEP_ID=MMETSP1392-20130828/4835_1 /ASSEMBLY_ACC=CAM_ASM_000868 /TAXON_ID=225041 /ORGANISM="Chlamydomonas chlamydogama, Strain SAG 11-48b" /LENGTH=317 /DNA_ID=CAMNT_0049580789 /DNA_START=51 /DNA_END=1004 /DNA_ORIENTATION=-